MVIIFVFPSFCLPACAGTHTRLYLAVVFLQTAFGMLYGQRVRSFTTPRFITPYGPSDI